MALVWVQCAGCLSQRACKCCRAMQLLLAAFGELCDREMRLACFCARAQRSLHSGLLQRLHLPTSHSNRTNAPFGVITQGKERDT